MMETLANLFDPQTIVLGAVFIAAVALFAGGAFMMGPAIATRRLINDALQQDGIKNRRALAAQAELVKLQAQAPVQAYFRAAEKERGEPDALEARLFRAGFHQSSAVLLFNITRLACVVLGFLSTWALLNVALPSDMPRIFAFGGAFLVGLGCIVIPSIALDRLETREKTKFRRGFPDFMDLMITCADAGMSLEAAVDRVSSELAGTHKSLGIQLSIMTLQMRAGKPLREALRDLADRIGIDEARALAVLFRQSEELGTSLTEALRVYSDEMRTQRILRAEERANALPVLMVLPLGLCIFPVVLMIVMLPVIIRMRGVFF